MRNETTETERQREYRLSACKGKQQFDRATANRVVRGTTKIPLDAYKCSVCGHWHVGAAKKKRKKVRVFE